MKQAHLSVLLFSLYDFFLAFVSSAFISACSVFLSVCLFFFLFLFFCSFFFLPVCLSSVRLPFLSFCLSAFLPFCLSVFLYFCLLICSDSTNRWRSLSCQLLMLWCSTVQWRSIQHHTTCSVSPLRNIVMRINRGEQRRKPIVGSMVRRILVGTTLALACASPAGPFQRRGCSLLCLDLGEEA